MTSQERRHSSRLQDINSAAGETQDFFNQLQTQSQHQSQLQNQTQSKPPTQTSVDKRPGIYLNSSPLIRIDLNV